MLREGTRHCFVWVLFCAVCLGSKAVQAEEPVYFADANLKAVVAMRTQMSEPTPNAMAGLTRLEADARGIVSLVGLEYAVNLTLLHLEDNQISNLSPLSGLTKLDEMHLDRNQISDISPLSGLTILRCLWLRGNQISDASPLSGLTTLRELNLESNHFSDAWSLSGLTQISYLCLYDNQIADISPLTGLTNLESLILQSNQIADISPLLSMPNLEGVDLWDNPLNRDAYCYVLQALHDADPMCGLSYSPNANSPGGVSAADGTDASTVAITWDALCPGPTRTDTFEYMVYRSDSFGGVKEAVSGWVAGTSFDDIMASPGVHYWYWVKSDKSGENYSEPDEGWRSAQPPKTLTISSTAGGTMSTPGIGAFQYPHSTSVPVVAAPAANYHFVNWTGTAVDAGRVGSPSSASTTVTMDADYTVQANFAIDRHALVVSSTAGGSVSSPGEGSFEYDHGTSIPIMAAGEAHYHFMGWTGTAVDAGKVANPSLATTTVIVDGDYTLHANFAIDRRTLTVSATAGGAVIAPGEGTFEYDYGQTITLQAQPGPLFTFVGWRGNVFTSQNPYPLTMDGDQNMTAHFESVLSVLCVDANAVGDSGPGDPEISDPQEDGTPEHPFDSVQEAIDVARTGTQVVVRPGTYFETIDLLGKSIEINGLNADDLNIMPLPVIDGGGSDTVVKFTQGEDPNCVLCGFVITSGRGRLGGGILCVGSSPTIVNCLIVGNRATALDAGGGIHCQDSNAVFVNCTISGNHGGHTGAGVCLSQSNATILDSIVWENTPTQIKLLGSDNSIVAYTAVAGGWPGEGILDADPLFAQPGYWADPANITKVRPATDPLAVWMEGDYRLMSQAGRWDPISGTRLKDPVTSPCIDAGDPDSPIGPEPLPNGGRVNTGVYGGTSQASMSTGDG